MTVLLWEMEQTLNIVFFCSDEQTTYLAYIQDLNVIWFVGDLEEFGMKTAASETVVEMVRA